MEMCDLLCREFPYYMSPLHPNGVLGYEASPLYNLMQVIET